jgi:hypothetical protein
MQQVRQPEAPLDWYLQVGALTLAILAMVAAPDWILYGAKSTYNALPFTNDLTLDPPKMAWQSAGDVKVSDESLDEQQKQNAAAIIKAGKELGATDRDIQTALTTALQESSMRNLDHGDDWWFAQTGGGKSDSMGLFQQRPSWGSDDERMNPEASAKLFYKALMQIPNRDQIPIGNAAQKVQVSAFPDSYAKWESTAAAILKTAKEAK